MSCFIGLVGLENADDKEVGAVMGDDTLSFNQGSAE